MFDLSALARRMRREPAGPVRLQAVPRVQMTVGCVVRCGGCQAATRRRPLEIDAVARDYRRVARSSTRVLLAGADPLTSSRLVDCVRLGRGLGLTVEVLTPGALLTAARVIDLRDAGLERVRVAVDPGRQGFPEALRGAATAKSVGMPVDLQLTVPSQHGTPLASLVACFDGLPIERIVVADDGCRSPSLPLPRWKAVLVAKELLGELRAIGPGSSAVCLDGSAFDEPLVHDAAAAIWGPEMVGAAQMRSPGVTDQGPG